MDASSEPSEYEQGCYYYGLPSSPRLVARSGTEPWTPRIDKWSSCPIHKSLRAIGKHAIVQKWNDDSPMSLRCQVVSLVEQRGLQWHAIDVLRIAYQDISDAPVVVFISVEPGTLSWRDGYSVVTQCRLLLAHHDLYDVECEVKESRFMKLATPKFLPLRHDAGTSPYAPPMSLISDCVGNVISPMDTPTQEGTSCLYLRDRHTDATYALTCRHVCFNAAGPGDSVELLPSTPSSQLSASMQKLMLQPGTTTFNKTHSRLRESIQFHEDQVRKLQERVSMDDDNRFIGQLERQQLHLDGLTPVFASFQARAQPSTRTFGQIAYVRGYGIRRHGELSDWSLVRLDQDRYETPFSELRNRVFVGTGFSTFRGQWVLHLPPDADGTYLLGGPLLGIASDLCTESPTRCTMPTNTVAKQGGMSGLTFGTYNEAKSVVRRITDSTQVIALEWCVVSYPHDRRTAAFSEAGDSGACIWEVADRRIAGMLTGGLGRLDVLQDGTFNLDMAVDVTYSTPIEWILEDIAACGIEVDIL